MLCFLGQSYIWVEGQKGLRDIIPRKLAVPWCAVSDYLGMKPVGCYAITTIYNLGLRNNLSPPWNAENLYTINTFTGTEDETWFYVIPMLIELEGVPSLRAIAQIYDNMDHHRDDVIIQSLLTMQLSLRNMRRELERMSEKCKPVVFYVDIRPYQAGSKGLDAFPQGIIYEGVSSKPSQYHGASAGQSSIIHTFDVFLGVKHTGSEKEFMDAMRCYMPQKHREFLELLGKRPPIREYCVKSGRQDLIAEYNKTIEEFIKFRSAHVITVTRYIVNQRHHSVNPSLETKGSGGTDFMCFLKKVRNETSELLIGTKI